MKYLQIDLFRIQFVWEMVTKMEHVIQLKNVPLETELQKEPVQKVMEFVVLVSINLQGAQRKRIQLQYCRCILFLCAPCAKLSVTLNFYLFPFESYFLTEDRRQN